MGSSILSWFVVGLFAASVQNTVGATGGGETSDLLFLEYDNLTNWYGDELPFEKNSVINGSTTLPSRHVPHLKQTGNNSFVLQMGHEMKFEGYSDEYEEHFIEGIWVKTVPEGEVVFFQPYSRDDEGMVNRIYFEFELDNDNNESIQIEPYALCNLHGLWKGDALTTVDSGSWNRAVEAINSETPVESQCTGEELYAIGNEGNAIGFEYLSNTLVTITMRFPTSSWFGIGIEADSMIGTDMVICGEVNGDVVCGDYYSFSRNPPSHDSLLGGSDDVIINSTAISTDGMVTATFSKPASRQDDSDTDITQILQQKVGQTELIFAFGTIANTASISPEVSFASYHGLVNRGYLTVDLLSADSGILVSVAGLRDTRDLKIVHGLLMYILWGILITTGGLIARYEKHTDWWLGAHKVLQSIATVVTLPAFLLTKAWSVPGSPWTTHAIIGFVIVFSSWLQSFTGATMYKLSKMSQHMYAHAAINLRGDALDAVMALKEKYGDKEILRSFSKEKAMLEDNIRLEVDSYIDSRIRSIGIPLVPYEIQRKLMRHFSQRVARPYHRFMGRILPFIAYSQVFLGIQELQVNVLVRNIVIFWTVMVALIVVYKESEMQFKLPHGFGGKFRALKRKIKGCIKSEVQEHQSVQGDDPSVNSSRDHIIRDQSERFVDIDISFDNSDGGDDHHGSEQNDASLAYSTSMRLKKEDRADSCPLPHASSVRIPPIPVLSFKTLEVVNDDPTGKDVNAEGGNDDEAKGDPSFKLLTKT